MSIYGSGCCTSSYIFDKPLVDKVDLLTCKKDCLGNPFCISYTVGEPENGKFKCNVQEGNARNFRIGCDLNLDPEKRQCYRRDKSSNKRKDNMPFSWN